VGYCSRSGMTYTQPLILVFLLIGAAGLVRLRDSKNKWLVTASLAGLFLLSWPPADWLFSRPLEARYPVRPFSPSLSPQGVVVLSEVVEPPQFEHPYPLPGEKTYERCKYAAWIYSRYGPLPVLASGGSGNEAGPPLSAAMRDLLVQEGVPKGLIWTEERSHSTRENAFYSTVILRERALSRVALVVDANSMPRAAECFRKLGIEVISAPCSIREFGALQDELLPSWKAIRRNEDTLHEILGLVWYRLRGWI
jgi:uncharacterized SAM-binding protein YcdF (DUF218 family)